MSSTEDLNVLSIFVEILDSMDNASAKRISDFLQSRFSNEQPKTISAQGKKKRGRPANPAKMINGIKLDAPTEKKKRGRPAKKKRGRPAKIEPVIPGSELNAPIEKKKRGRPAKKKRGRPAKIAVVA